MQTTHFQLLEGRASVPTDLEEVSAQLTATRQQTSERIHKHKTQLHG